MRLLFYVKKLYIHIKATTGQVDSNIPMTMSKSTEFNQLNRIKYMTTMMMIMKLLLNSIILLSQLYAI